MNSNSNKWRLVLISVTPAILIWFSTGLVADIGDDTAAMWIRRALELTVMTLQVGGLAALIASKLAPASSCAGSATDRGAARFGCRRVVVRRLPLGLYAVRRGNFADFRGRLTCLFDTQFSPRSGQFFPVFSAIERRNLGAV